jgi:hypothetical protein
VPERFDIPFKFLFREVVGTYHWLTQEEHLRRCRAGMPALPPRSAGVSVGEFAY